MDFLTKPDEDETLAYKRGLKRRLKKWRRIASVALCIALLGTNIGANFSIAAATDDSFVIMEDGEQNIGNGQSETDTEEETATPSDTAAPQEEQDTVYTLHLTHHLRFTENGKGKHISVDEEIKLTDADCTRHKYCGRYACSTDDYHQGEIRRGSAECVAGSPSGGGGWK